MPVIGQPVVPEFPPEVIDKLIASMKQKLPMPVDEAILRDIIKTNMDITWEYIQNLPQK
jgi:hypothetical protein